MQLVPDPQIQANNTSKQHDDYKFYRLIVQLRLTRFLIVGNTFSDRWEQLKAQCQNGAYVIADMLDQELVYGIDSQISCTELP